MLKRVGKSGLEFNSPAHGNWNIVHTGMLLPEARQIYVCADNCMRGVVLTAAEMNAADRFSFVIVEEENLLNGNLEDVTIEGVTDVLQKLDERPKAVLLFTVCLHHFQGCDLERVYEELEERFPDIVFIRCYMDPIMQKHGLTPDQKLRKAIYDPLPVKEADPDVVTLLGSDFALDETSDIKRLLRMNGMELRELPECRTWKDYERLSDGNIFIACYPPGKYGMEMQAERLGRNGLYLPGSFDYEEIREQIKKFGEIIEDSKKILRDITEQKNVSGEEESGKLKNEMTGRKEIDRDKNNLSERALPDTEMLDIKILDIEKEIAACESALREAGKIIGDTPVMIDHTFHPRPLGLAKLLLTHGFHVTRIYLDAVSPEEREVSEWLQKEYPDLAYEPTIQPEMRMRPRNEKNVLAIGQKAAWFTGSRHFINLVQGAGLYGYDGIRRTAELMIEAWQEEKDPEDLIIRKGWGCESCI